MVCGLLPDCFYGMLFIICLLFLWFVVCCLVVVSIVCCLLSGCCSQGMLSAGWSPSPVEVVAPGTVKYETVTTFRKTSKKRAFTLVFIFLFF